MSDPIRYLMDMGIITTEVAISEETLRDRLKAEVLENLGMIGPDGEVRPGVTSKVLRGEGGKGGYRVQITRDMSKDTTPRIEGPRNG